MPRVVINREQHQSQGQAILREEQACDEFCFGVEVTVKL